MPNKNGKKNCNVSFINTGGIFLRKVNDERKLKIYSNKVVECVKCSFLLLKENVT